MQAYRQGVESMQAQQAKLQQTELQLGSGLKIMKPSDDPSGAVKVLNLNNSIGAIDQFSRNASLAEASLGFEESVVANVNNNLQRIRELAVQGNNATNSPSDRVSIAEEIYQRLDEMLALANTRNASGEYIFGGFKVDAPPFVSNGGTVSYQGDQGQRFLQVAQGSQVAVGNSGDSIFQRIRSGDGNVQVVSSPANTGTAVVGAFGLNGSFVSDTYTVTFAQAVSTDPITYTVTDGGAATVASGTYNEGDSIAFAGAQFALTGLPAQGDEITVSPSQNRDVFTTAKAIADALVRPAPLPQDVARFHNEMGQGLANLDQAISGLSSVRAGIGARLNNLETIESINQDFKLQLQTVLSETQDLDFAEAISRFNLQLTSLQAAQQAFVKTSGLSLFNYL
jgi:flagellar hook-associated protein 3 FlgL